MTRSFIKLAALASMAVSVWGLGTVAAEAQQRPGMPPVMKKAPPPELPDQMEVVKAFFKENRKNKRPRFLLFWNRELSDEVVTYYIDYTAKAGAARCRSGWTYQGCRAFNGTASTDKGAATVTANSLGAGSSYSGVNVEFDGVIRLNKDQAREQLREVLNMKLENTFKQYFIKGGARLINREMAIRVTGSKAQTNEKVNTHSLETAALQGKADYLVEVVLVPDFESETGLSFQANVVGIETAETIASIYTEAMPPVVEHRYYEATDKGFQERSHVEGLTDVNVGKQLAIDTMREITDYWRMMSSMDE